MQGLILKGIGGFYYVKTEEGIVEAKGRGIFKKDSNKLAVGDMVELELLDEEPETEGIKLKGVINDILPRKNSFIRPPIVNVDTFVITFAVKDPEPNFVLIDKFLIMAEMNNVETIIVMNKCDLADEDILKEYRSIYDKVYKVIEVSSVNNQGLDELKKAISGKRASFAGPSGVGKSTIINSLIPDAEMETGNVSEKTKRGKHTTRHVEIFEAEGGGLVFDTPGFTSFEIMEADESNLQDFYPEIEKYKGKCYYDNCKHLKEPDCMVKAMVKAGEINRKRYESYKFILDEIKNSKKY